MTFFLHLAMASVQPVDSIFKFPGQECSGENTITIDAAFLEKRPFLAHRAVYAELGSKVTSLTLSLIDEQEAISIVPLFTALRHFSLQKVTILNGPLSGWPTGIETLQLTDCKIPKDVAKSWFKSIGKSLLNVQMARCCHAVQFGMEGSFADLAKHLPDSIRSLSVYDPICTYLRVGQLPPSLEYCHLEAPMDTEDHLVEWVRSSSVKTLILKLHLTRSDSIEYLKEMKFLENLRVLNSVDFKMQSLLESLKLKTLDVHCYSPPAKENLIFTLNDDCLIHVLSFLEQEEWLTLSQAHPRFNRLMATYIYPHKEIDMFDGFLEDLSKKEREAVMSSLEQHATSVYVGDEDWPQQISRFKKLEKLYVTDCLSNDGKRAIPNGIKKLELEVSLVDNDNDWYDDEYDEMPEGMSDYEYDSDTDEMVKKYRVSELFCRLSTTLTSLTLKGDFDPSDLSELKSLREFKVENLKRANLLEILRQNKDHLERLEVKFYNEHKKEYKWYAYWDHDDFSEDYVPPSRFQLCPLKCLKVLHLTGINCRIELKQSDFPSLEELNVSFDCELEEKTKSYILEAVSKFDQIKSLNVDQRSVDWLASFKNLQCLNMYFENDTLLDLVRRLPKLSKLQCSPRGLDFKTEAELRKFLVEEKRTLRFCEHNLVLP